MASWGNIGYCFSDYIIRGDNMDNELEQAMITLLLCGYKLHINKLEKEIKCYRIAMFIAVGISVFLYMR